MSLQDDRPSPSAPTRAEAGEAAQRPAPRTPRRGAPRLLLIKTSLVLILLGMLIVGKRNGIWPVITWGMYARLFEAPDPLVTELRVDVVTAGGERRPFLMREIAPTGEHQQVAKMVTCTQHEPDPARRAQCAAAVEALARWAVPDRPLAAIELWEVDWEADIRALPPLDRDAPSAERLLGRLPLQGLQGEAQGDTP